jgi:hypothetical protein
LGLIDRVIRGLTFGSLTNISKKEFAKPVESHAPHIAGGNNPVSVDIVPLNGYGMTCYFLDWG